MPGRHVPEKYKKTKNQKISKKHNQNKTKTPKTTNQKPKYQPE